MELITVEKKVGEIAAKMGLSYMCETWARANVLLDKFRRVGASRSVQPPDGYTLPVCIYVQPVAGAFKFTKGGYVKDAPSCFISFADAMPLDFTGDEAQSIAERLKGIATDFIAEVNNSGAFEPIYGDVSYKIGFDRLDACLCIVSITPTLAELHGVCVEED